MKLNLRKLKTETNIIITLKSPLVDAIANLRLKIHTPPGLTLNMIAFSNIEKRNYGATVCGRYFSLKSLEITMCKDDFNCDKCLFGKEKHHELLTLKQLVSEI